MYNKEYSPTECVLLPPELLEEIFIRLLPTDRIRFGSVCKPWLSAVISKNARVPEPAPEPWLMLGHRDRDSYLRNNKFHCLSDKRVYRFNNVVPKDYKVLTMSSDGWLLTLSPGSSHLKLVNPISDAQIRMIPPESNWYDVTKIKKLLVLEPSPTTTAAESIVTTVVMLIPSPGSSVVYTLRYTNYKFEALGYKYDDIVLYKGKLYSLIIRNGFGIHFIDRMQDFRVHGIQGIAPNSRNDEAYLVESGGDLLLVRRQHNDLLQTVGFDVYKLTVEDRYEVDAVKLQSLGDHQALFWGRQGCFSLPVGESSLFKEDHIYLAHILKKQPLTEEYGVYSLKDGSIKQIPNLNLPRPASASAESFWFFPTVKDTTVYPKIKTKLKPLVDGKPHATKFFS